MPKKPETAPFYLRALRAFVMKSPRFLRMPSYRNIAFINLGCGAALAAGTFIGVIRFFSIDEPTMMFLAGSLLALFAFIAAGLIYTAVTHIKNPRQSSALTLAVNSSVIIGLLAAGILDAAGLDRVIGPAYIGVALVIAYAAYRFLLKPAALQ